MREELKCVLNVFSVNKKSARWNSAEYGVLIDLTSKTELKSYFKSLLNFLCPLTAEYEILSEIAKLVLLCFSTTFLVKTGFFAYTATRMKYRNFLNA